MNTFSPPLTLDDLPLGGQYAIPRCRPEQTGGIVGIARLGDLVIVSTVSQADRFETHSRLVFLSENSRPVPPPIELNGKLACAAGVGAGRIAVGTSDGLLHVFDAESGAPMHGFPKRIREGGARITAPPLLLGPGPNVYVGTQIETRFENAGHLCAFGPTGRSLWPHLDHGCLAFDSRIAGMAAWGDVIFITAERNNPLDGLVYAIDAKTGSHVWRKPFALLSPKEYGPNRRLAGAPLLRSGKVIVASNEGYVYVLDASTGVLIDRSPQLGGQLDATPVWFPLDDETGLIIARTARTEAADSRWRSTTTAPMPLPDVTLHAWEPGTSTIAWRRSAGRCLGLWLGLSNEPNEAGDACVIVARPRVEPSAKTAPTGPQRSFTLPWHGGELTWAAERLEQAGRWEEAADLWERAGDAERAASAWEEAGNEARLRRPRDAAHSFKHAAAIRRRLKQWNALNRCTKAASDCARLPFFEAEAMNTVFAQFDLAQLVVALENVGSSQAPDGIALILWGALSEPVWRQVMSDVPSGGRQSVPMSLTPMQEVHQLFVELSYDSGDPEFGALSGVFAFEIRAAARPRPLEFHGDLAALQVTVAEATLEGARISFLGDVGMAKFAGSVSNVSVQRDLGALISRLGE